MKLLFLGACLFIALLMWVTILLTSCKLARNRLLGVTLPREAQQLPEVTGILSRFKRAICLFYPILMLCAIPILLLPNSRPSYFLLYVWCWMLPALWGGERLYRRYNRELYALKRQRGWLMGRQHIVTVDTQVSRLKQTMPVSRWWFLPSIAISLICPLAAISMYPEFSNSGWIGAFIPMLMTISFVLMHHVAATRPTQVYSENSEINRACNYICQRSWSICWVVCSLLQGVGGSLFFLFLYLQPENLYSAWIFLPVVLWVVSLLVVLMYTHSHIRQRQNLLLAAQDTPVYVDEDEYWSTGFYNNPNNSRVLVEKRDGTGFTLNLATFWGKVITYATFLIAGGILVFSSVLLVLMDNSSFPLTVEGGNASISAPLYGVSFSLDQVEEVTVLDTLPQRRRTNGTATSSYDLGHYSVSGYGACTLFIHKDNPPYLLVRLPDRTILLNGATPEQTWEYERLLRREEPAS